MALITDLLETLGMLLIIAAVGVLIGAHLGVVVGLLAAGLGCFGASLLLVTVRR